VPPPRRRRYGGDIFSVTPTLLFQPASQSMYTTDEKVQRTMMQPRPPAEQHRCRRRIGAGPAASTIFLSLPYF
jgi:hypothetical protein